MRIIPIASGKGGVGKSLFAVNLSIALAEAGNKTFLVDLDLGASNAHTVLGIRGVKKGIGNLLTDSTLAIEDIIIETEYKNLYFISGEGEIPGLANIKSFQKNSLIKKLKKLNADYMILDLGAGTNSLTLDFFLMSSEGVVITTPNLTAILNAYMFLKSAVFRVLFSTLPKKSVAREYFDNIMSDGQTLQTIYMPKLFDKLKSIDKENYEVFIEKFKNLKPKLIMNMLEDAKDNYKSQKIRVSCKQYLDLEVDHYGVIYRDHLQDIALSSRLPIIKYKSESVITQAIYRIAEKIEQNPPKEYTDFQTDDIEENYQLADQEALTDFESRVDEVKSLINTGILTNGDMIETIRTQQYEIDTLKKENAMLKKKIVKAINDGFKL